MPTLPRQPIPFLGPALGRIPQSHRGTSPTAAAVRRAGLHSASLLLATSALAAPIALTVRQDGVYRVDLGTLDVQLQASASLEEFPYDVANDPFDDTLIVVSNPHPHQGFELLSRLDPESGEVTDLGLLGGDSLSWSITSTEDRVLGTDGSLLYELGTAPAIRQTLLSFPDDRTATALFTVAGTVYALLDDDQPLPNCDLHEVDPDLGTTTLRFEGLPTCGREGALVVGRDVYLLWAEVYGIVDPPFWTMHVHRLDLDTGALEEVVREELGELVYGVTQRGTTTIDVPAGGPSTWFATATLISIVALLVLRRDS